MRKLLLVFLILALVLIPGALAAENLHTVRDDLQAFVEAFQLAAHGNWQGAVDALFWSIPLFALIVIIYGLVYFAGSVSLFKEEGHEKYARMIALGVALIGLVQQKVYDWILGISTTFIMVAFVIVIIFMFIMMLRHLRTENAKVGKVYYEKKNEELTAKHALSELKHGQRMDNAESKHVWNSLRSLHGDLEHMSRLEGTLLHQIDQLLALVGKAYAAKRSGEGTDKLNRYAESLSRGVHTLASTMKSQQVYEHKAGEIIQRLSAEIAQWGHATNAELGVDKRFEHIMEKVLGRKNINFKPGAVHKIRNEEAQIHSLLNRLHEYMHELKTLEDKMKALDERVKKHIGLKAAHDVTTIQGHIASTEFDKAQQSLGALRRLVAEDEFIIQELSALDVEAKHLLKNITAVEHSLAGPINDILHKLTEDIASKQGAPQGQ